MANWRPLPGKCNARLGSGEFCPTEGTIASVTGEEEPRCIGHSGGKVTPVQSYEQAMMRGADKARKRLFKLAPRGTNLETEIAIVRLHLAELEQTLSEGEMAISVGCGDDGKPRAVLISDLINKEHAMLNALVRTQAENHPERRVGGNMTLTVKLEGHPMLDGDVSEELEADVRKELPASEQIVDQQPATAVPVDDKFSELDEP